MLFFSLILLSVAIATVFATTGVDISQRTYRSSWDCAKSYGYDFAVVRVYQSLGQPDPNGPANINDAWAAGFSHVDGYIFPCYSCGNPKKQMDDTINYLNSHGIYYYNRESIESNSTVSANTGVKFGMLWFDIEGTQYWSSSASNNINFLQQMVDEGRARGIGMGVYSSAWEWNPIMGGTSQFSSLPLWYAHWDGALTMSDYQSFGGWSKPAMKQYAGDVSFCSAGWDKNFY